MDYCHMICHVLFHVISNNFVTVSISQTGVRIHAMTSSVAYDVLVTCFNDVILRHLPLYDWSVPALGTWNQSFGFFPEWIFLPKWIFPKSFFPIMGKVCQDVSPIEIRKFQKFTTSRYNQREKTRYLIRPMTRPIRN
jgi:uncharacterized membrane protein